MRRARVGRDERRRERARLGSSTARTNRKHTRGLTLLAKRPARETGRVLIDLRERCARIPTRERSVRVAQQGGLFGHTIAERGRRSGR